MIESADRVDLDNGRIRGSFSLTGGRIDNLILSDYKLTTAPGSPDVALLSPPGSFEPYFVEFGWVSVDQSVAVPGRDAVWSADRTELRPGQPVTLTWDNGEGLRFERRVEIDDAYMFTITQRVVNDGDAGGLALSLRPGQPLGHARDARLLHPARGPDRRAERPAGGDRLRRPAGRRPTSSCRAGAAGWASPTSTGWRRWCRIRRASSPEPFATTWSRARTATRSTTCARR